MILRIFRDGHVIIMGVPIKIVADDIPIIARRIIDNNFPFRIAIKKYRLEKLAEGEDFADYIIETS